MNLISRSHYWKVDDGHALPNAHFKGSGLLGISRVLFFAFLLFLLGGWILWFVIAEIPVSVNSQFARFESTAAAHRLRSDVEGRVTHVRLALGQVVDAGEVLINLEKEEIQLRITERESELEAKKNELLAVEEVLISESAALSAATAVAAALANDSDSYDTRIRKQSEIIERRADRARSLFAEGHLGASELDQADLEIATRSVENFETQVDHRKNELGARIDEFDRRTRVASLSREKRRIESDIATLRVQVRQLQFEEERRRIRSPIAGTIVEFEPISPGALLEKGQKIAHILPSEDVKIVAYLEPRDALGRIQEGQSARFRLDGFPWTEYGAVEARVSAVSSEPTNGLIRIELDPGEPDDRRLPFRHGVPGQVQVRIDIVSPWQFLTGALGANRVPDPEKRNSP